MLCWQYQKYEVEIQLSKEFRDFFVFGKISFVLDKEKLKQENNGDNIPKLKAKYSIFQSNETTSAD